MATKLGRVGISGASLQQAIKAVWSHGLARSLEKLDVSYLYYHKDYGNQTWEGDDLLWERSFFGWSQTTLWASGHMRSRNK